MNEMMIEILRLKAKDDDYVDFDYSENSQETEIDLIRFKWDECEFKCKNEITLRRHVNTKNAAKTTNDGDIDFSVYDSECSLCDYKFNTAQDFINHIKGYMDEIEELDLDLLKNGHGINKCNICKYESSDDKEIKMHLINQVQSIK